MQAQANELTKLVKALARVVPQQLPDQAKPFAGQAARLTWPVDGRMLKNFGAPRADGRLKWEGVLLGAPAGSPVRSVYNGRVVFAEWLAGLGLLTIVDHGGGYMTLYGHNQALLKDVGDRVNTGRIHCPGRRQWWPGRSSPVFRNPQGWQTGKPGQLDQVRPAEPQKVCKF